MSEYYVANLDYMNAALNQRLQSRFSPVFLAVLTDFILYNELKLHISAQEVSSSHSATLVVTP